MQEFIREFLPDGGRPLIIRDPVHDYIELTPIERDLIDTQIFQRLRFVSQNSTVFYTYPANFSSRFQHSLGAAHLSGRFISAALQSTEPATVDRFLVSFNNFLTEASRETSIDIASYERYSRKAIVWQVTRLTVLLHDVGHLPFSHLTEFALEPHYALLFAGHAAEPLWQAVLFGGTGGMTGNFQVHKEVKRRKSFVNLKGGYYDER
jgi:HD superfamily phosphohydrolase